MLPPKYIKIHVFNEAKPDIYVLSYSSFFGITSMRYELKYPLRDRKYLHLYSAGVSTVGFDIAASFRRRLRQPWSVCTALDDRGWPQQPQFQQIRERMNRPTL